MCVCVFFPIYSGPGSHRISHPPSFCGGACLNFLVRRIQPFLFLVNREVEFLRTNELIVLHLLGIYFILFIYLVWGKKKNRYRDSNSRPNASEGYEPNELPGKKKERKITTQKRKKRKKHLTVVDPETLFMRNSKLIYCPKTCIA